MKHSQNLRLTSKKDKAIYFFVAFALIFSGSLMIGQFVSKKNQQTHTISYIPDSLIKVQNTSSGSSINNAQQGKNSKTPCYTSKQQSGITEVNLRNCKLDKKTTPNKPNKTLSHA